MILDEDVYLEHLGVKGMKWGVRRGYRNQALERAARGEGGLATKARALANLKSHPIALIKGHGIKGGSQRIADKFNMRESRIKSGKAHVLDHIRHYASTRPTDLIPVSSKNEHKKTKASADKVLVAVAGAIFVKKVLMNRTLRAVVRMKVTDYRNSRR